MTSCKCPPFLSIPYPVLAKWEYQIDDEVFFPSCPGKWTVGSGGHRMHDGSCEQRSTWWHPDDMHSYCDEHCPEQDKASYNALWERTFLEGYPFPTVSQVKKLAEAVREEISLRVSPELANEIRALDAFDLASKVLKRA